MPEEREVADLRRGPGGNIESLLSSSMRDMDVEEKRLDGIRRHAATLSATQRAAYLRRERFEFRCRQLMHKTRGIQQVLDSLED